MSTGPLATHASYPARVRPESSRQAHASRVARLGLDPKVLLTDKENLKKDNETLDESISNILSSIFRPVPNNMACDAPWLLGCVIRALYRFKPFAAFMPFSKSEQKLPSVPHDCLATEGCPFYRVVAIINHE